MLFSRQGFQGRSAGDRERPDKVHDSGKQRQKMDSDEWLPSTFINLLAWKELGEQIADRYADKDEIEVIAKYQPHSYNKVTYPEFVVREVVRMKPESTAENPYPSGDKPAQGNGDFEEMDNDPDSLPF